MMLNQKDIIMVAGKSLKKLVDKSMMHGAAA